MNDADVAHTTRDRHPIRNPFHQEALLGVGAKHSAKGLCFSGIARDRMLRPYRYRYSTDGFGINSIPMI